MSLSIIVTGTTELDHKLAALPEKVQKKIAKKALNAGLTIEVRAMKKAAPVGLTGQLRSAIGKRILRDRQTGISHAKAGINVGSRKAESKALRSQGVTVKTVGRSKWTSYMNQLSAQTGKFAAHGHFVALGTQPRRTASGANRGTMPANHFIRVAAASVHGAVMDKMREVILKGIEAEVAKK